MDAQRLYELARENWEEFSDLLRNYLPVALDSNARRITMLVGAQALDSFSIQGVTVNVAIEKYRASAIVHAAYMQEAGRLLNHRDLSKENRSEIVNFLSFTIRDFLKDLGDRYGPYDKNYAFRARSPHRAAMRSASAASSSRPRSPSPPRGSDGRFVSPKKRELDLRYVNIGRR